MTQLAPDPTGYDTFDDPRPRYRICRFAFGLAGIALGVQSAEIALHLYAMFTSDGRLGPLIGHPAWSWWVGTPITFGAALASYLFIGRFPDEAWNRRALLLAAMNTFDIGLWVSDHARELPAVNLLGFWAQNPLVREGLYGLQWFELWLFTALAGELIRHLGRETTGDMQRTGRALAGFGFFAWLVSFAMEYSLRAGGVPPRPRVLRQHFMMWLLSRVLLAATAFQATAMCLIAARECRKLLGELRRAESEPGFWPTSGGEGGKAKQRDDWT